MATDSAQLVWSPVYSVLEERMKTGDDIVLIIVPFIKLDAFKQLHWVQTKQVRLKVVCRWCPDDLLTGASDVEVFPYLKAAGCELYLNSDIHLKLYVFASNLAFNTSANLSLRGLGYSEAPNIEVGNMVQLAPQDWAHIYSTVATSRQVDDDMYGRFKKFVEEHRYPGPSRIPPDLLGTPKAYTIASLPATETPTKLAAYYFSSDRPAAPEDVRRAVHDLVTFGIPSDLSKEDFEGRLGTAFRASPFVADFVDFIRQRKSLRFGIVNDWIHSKCEDVPLPYRWEIKENTRIFYDWLAHFVPQITWDRPHHSQVIHWQEQ